VNEEKEHKMKWIKVKNKLPPYYKHILGIDERGFILQTRRFKKWDKHWIAENNEQTKWQYWCELPDIPTDVRKSYDA